MSMSSAEFIKELGDLIERMVQSDKPNATASTSTSAASVNQSANKVETPVAKNVTDKHVDPSSPINSFRAVKNKDAKPEVDPPLKPTAIITLVVDPITMQMVSCDSPFKDADHTKTCFCLCDAVSRMQAQDNDLEPYAILSDLIDVLAVTSMRGMAKAFHWGIK